MEYFQRNRAPCYKIRDVKRYVRADFAFRIFRSIPKPQCAQPRVLFSADLHSHEVIGAVQIGRSRKPRPARAADAGKEQNQFETADRKNNPTALASRLQGPAGKCTWNSRRVVIDADTPRLQGS